MYIVFDYLFRLGWWNRLPDQCWLCGNWRNMPQEHASHASILPSKHNSNLHIFNVERYVGWCCILNCFMLSSLPCFHAFCWSAILTSCYLFNVLYSCNYVLAKNTSNACMTIKALFKGTIPFCCVNFSCSCTPCDGCPSYLVSMLFADLLYIPTSC